MSESFHFADREVGAEVVTEGVSKVQEVANRRFLVGDLILDADEDFLLKVAAAEIAILGAMASAGEGDGFDAREVIFDAGFIVGVGITIIVNTLVESNIDAAESVDDIFERAPVDVGVIINIEAENVANFGHESVGASVFVVAFEIVAPINFIDFIGGSAGGADFEVARNGKHSGVASVLVEADHHDGVGEFGAVMGGLVEVGALHIEAAGAESENVGAAVLVGSKRLVGLGEEVGDVAAAVSETSNEVVAPEDEPNYATDE